MATPRSLTRLLPAYLSVTVRIRSIHGGNTLINEAAGRDNHPRATSWSLNATHRSTKMNRLYTILLYLSLLTKRGSSAETPISTSTLISPATKMCRYYAHTYACGHTLTVFAAYCAPAALIQRACGGGEIWQSVRMDHPCASCPTTGAETSSSGGSSGGMAGKGRAKGRKVGGRR
ncbi:hypothetical protein H2201_001158 [Coniosporium apollinis]|uniref:Uncharacterized protein n=1 Tax=Coniosporium apollinis TaxID=61459 RepID=A0ABQ9P2C6_9PEZI|nr:hypothetical protein H2201_001158 [Coniosporium apollinis]